MSTSSVIIYTDGSASVKERNGGWAYVALHGNRFKHGSGSARPATISQMELLAIAAALENIEPCDLPLEVFSDSRYAVDCIQQWIPTWLQNGWRTRVGEDVKNKDMLQRVWSIVQVHRKIAPVRFTWVPGHAGNPYNGRADELAGAARVKGSGETHYVGEIKYTSLTLRANGEKFKVLLDSASRRVVQATTRQPDVARKLSGLTTKEVYKLAKRRGWQNV